jgi:hypothetical protein
MRTLQDTVNLLQETLTESKKREAEAEAVPPNTGEAIKTWL